MSLELDYQICTKPIELTEPQQRTSPVPPKYSEKSSFSKGVVAGLGIAVGKMNRGLLTSKVVEVERSITS